MKCLAISILFCFLLVQGGLGHGAMYFPNPWWATSECTLDMRPDDCEYGLELPSTGCTGECSNGIGLTSFFTNYTFVKEATLPEEFFDKSVRRETKGGLHPWNSPGSAPTFGNGCGVNGGNPDGCEANGGNPDDNVYGRCCGGRWKNDAWKPGCGGFAGGKSALSHYEDGFFGTPKVTTWKRGTNQDVYWESKAYHRGGYAYRLCKVNNGKIWEVTEECFQNGHLKFAGDKTWRYYDSKGVKGDEPFNPDNFEEETAIRTNIGTNPEGSEWAKNIRDLPRPQDRGSSKHWAFKDLVEVPENLEPGEYVLSFRWDCQQSPQVWNSCANIQIV